MFTFPLYFLYKKTLLLQIQMILYENIMKNMTKNTLYAIQKIFSIQKLSIVN